MLSLENLLLKMLWRSRVNLLAMLSIIILIGLFGQNAYQQFLFSQAQNISGLSVFNHLLFPLIGLTLISQIFLTVLASSQLMPKFYVNGQSSLFGLAKLTPYKKIKLMLKVVLVYSSVPLIILSCFGLALSFYSQLDLFRLVVVVAGLFMIQVNLSLLVIAIHNTTKNILSAIVLAVSMILLLITIDVFSQTFAQSAVFTFRIKGLFSSLFELRYGILNWLDITAYIVWFCLFFSVAFLSHSKSIKNNNLCSKGIVSQSKQAKKAAVIAMMLILSMSFFSVSTDITQHKINSLSAKLTQQLIASKQALEIRAVIDDKSNQDEIIRGFNLVKAVLPRAKLEFVAKQSIPPEQQINNQYLQFKLGAIEQSVAYPFNQNVKAVFETVLWQMLSRKQQWVTFIEGHGEASPFSQAPNDFSQLHQILKQKGWPVAAQNLAQMPIISDNTGLLVVANSKQEWQAKETQLVLQYLAKGGNLLLLIDPNNKLPFELLDHIGVELVDGTLVDWQGYQSGTPHPAIVIIQPNNQHAVTQNIQQVLAFPWSTGLNATKKNKKQDVLLEPILSTNKSVWNELAVDAETITFDQRLGEQQQNYILALSHTNLKNGQKIIVVGDSHFAANSAINNYANKQLALNFVSWLTNIKSSQIVQKHNDHSIQPSQGLQFFMKWFFTCILPLFVLLLAGIGFYQRKQSWQG
jgi:hypothetical protein